MLIGAGDGDGLGVVVVLVVVGSVCLGRMWNSSRTGPAVISKRAANGSKPTSFYRKSVEKFKNNRGSDAFLFYESKPTLTMGNQR